MSEPQDAAAGTGTSGDHAGPLPDPKAMLGELAAAAETASLVSDIKGKAVAATTKVDGIEQDRLRAEAARLAIDVQVAAMKEATSGLQQQVDAAKTLIAEVTTLNASAQTNSNQTVEVKSQAAAALQSLQTLLATATDAANRIETARTSADQTQGVIATKSDHIESARVHADKVRGDLDRLATEAQASATNAEGRHQDSRKVLDDLNTLFGSAQTVKSTIDSSGDAIATLRQACEAHAVTTKKLAGVAEATDGRVKKYEQDLAGLQQSAAERLKTIDELLLGATNAGLAHAFDKRSQRFKTPEKRWQAIFVGSLMGLFALAIWHAWSFSAAAPPPGWQELARLLVYKVPFLIPLVWLALHSARQAAFAKRMEEEYAFKATVSTSFEGYRRQMAEISKDLSPTSPLARLCNNTLGTIAAPPGQIYDKHRMDPTPATAAAEFVGPVVDGVTKALAAKLPGLNG